MLNMIIVKYDFLEVTEKCDNLTSAQKLKLK